MSFIKDLETRSVKWPAMRLKGERTCRNYQAQNEISGEQRFSKRILSWENLLRGYQDTEVAPGRSTAVQFRLPRQQFRNLRPRLTP